MGAGRLGDLRGAADGQSWVRSGTRSAGSRGKSAGSGRTGRQRVACLGGVSVSVSRDSGSRDETGVGCGRSWVATARSAGFVMILAMGSAEKSRRRLSCMILGTQGRGMRLVPPRAPESWRRRRCARAGRRGRSPEGRTRFACDWLEGGRADGWRCQPDASLFESGIHALSPSASRDPAYTCGLGAAFERQIERGLRIVRLLETAIGVLGGDDGGVVAPGPLLRRHLVGRVWSRSLAIW